MIALPNAAKRLMSIPDIVEITAIAVVATINDTKNARLIWALLHAEKEYQIYYVK